jgi:transposase
MPSLELVPVSGRYLSLAEREEVAILNAQSLGVREIARRISRSPSTISRELRRNASTRSNELAYRATTAQWHAERRANRPKVSKLAADERLRDYVQDRLAGAISRPDGELVPGPIIIIKLSVEPGQPHVTTPCAPRSLGSVVPGEVFLSSR